MLTNRYKAERETGSDWKVVDQLRNIDSATGLTMEEAENTAYAWNKAEREKAKEFSI